MAGKSQHGSVFSLMNRSDSVRNGSSLAQVKFAREFHEKIIGPLMEQRRSLANRGCLERGTEVAPRSMERGSDLRHFERRVRQKLEMCAIIPLFLYCGTRLLELGEFGTARIVFFEEATRLCDELLKAGGGSTDREVCDGIEIASWRVDAIYGRTESDVERIRCGDAAVRPCSAQSIR